MPKVRTLSLRGKTVNLPHTEQTVGLAKSAVSFDENGVAEVSETGRDALLELYPFDVEEVVEAKAPAPRSKSKASK